MQRGIEGKLSENYKLRLSLLLNNTIIKIILKVTPNVSHELSRYKIDEEICLCLPMQFSSSKSINV